MRQTVDSLVKQHKELRDCAVHLLPVEVEERNNLKVHLSEEIGQLVDVRYRSTQLRVVDVVHVANQQSYFVCCCGGEGKM